MMRLDPLRQMLMLILAAALAFAVFAARPGIDLWVTGLFFNTATGLFSMDSGLPNTIRLAIWRLSEAMLMASVMAVVVGLWTKADVLAVPRRVSAYILTLYLLAPGLLVDGILKRLWGRARPADVTEFGGTLLFTPPHLFAHQCARNCSFVAGEMAGAVALAVAVVMIVHLWKDRISARAYRGAVAVAVLLPVYAGFQRIAAGRHFLSDVIFATLFVLMVAVALRAIMFRPAAR